MGSASASAAGTERYDDEPDANENMNAGVLSAKELENQGTTAVLKSYYRHFGPATPMITSYNHFMKHSLPEIVTTCGRMELTEEPQLTSMNVKLHKVKINRVKIERKVIRMESNGELRELYPHEARLRNLHYMKLLYAEVEHSIYNVDGAGHKTQTLSETDTITLGEIPIMVKSEYCNLHKLSRKELADMCEDPDDPGGYFIINGKEKVLISQERAAHNKLFLFKPMCDADYQLEAELRSTSNINTDEVSALWIRIPGDPKSQKLGELRSVSHTPTSFDPRLSSTGNLSTHHHVNPVPDQGWLLKHQKFIKRKYSNKFPGLIVRHMALMDSMPLMILFKALGFMTDESISQVISQDDSQSSTSFVDLLQSSFLNVDAVTIKTKDEALIFIGKLRKQTASERYEDPTTGARRVYSDDEYLTRGMNFINEEVLPHVGDGVEEFDNVLKGYHIGYMVNRLINAYEGIIPCDDRDHLENKRFDLAGPLMAQLTKRLVISRMQDMFIGIKRKVDNKRRYDFFKQIGSSSTLTKGYIYSFSSGNWGDKKRSSTVRTGVVQPLNRVTALASLSFLRRINSPVNRLVRMVVPRLVHNTGFGYICPCDTPEGEPVGLLKNLAVMAHVSTDCDLNPVLQCLEDLQYTPIEDNFGHFKMNTKIIINASLIGSYPMDREASKTLIYELKQRRTEWDEIRYLEQKRKNWLNISKRKKLEREQGLPDGSLLNDRRHDYTLEDEPYSEAFKGISNQISIAHLSYKKEIHIRTDGGRAIRPLFVVERNQVKLKRHHIERLRNTNDNYSWPDLLKDGIIEYLDAAEEETAMIAMFPSDLADGACTRTSKPAQYRGVRYTHCEISPAGIFGICASLVPFANHEQSPRLTYQSNMAKQAIGVYMPNFMHRYDTDSHVIHYPQRALVTTQAAEFSKYDDNPCGINATVAIFSFGYNQEDSVVMNTSSIQRGLFRSTNFKTKTDEARTNKEHGDANEMFERPKGNEIGRMRLSLKSYDKLDDDGFPHVGDVVVDGCAIIGKTQNISKIIRTQEEMSGRRCPIKQDVSEVYKSSSASQPSHVDSVLVTNNSDGYRMVKVRLRTQRIPQMGDKFASRHGQKGVMGLEMHELDLPFTADGIVPDIVMNPHAIPSRMTIGHLLEMCFAKAGAKNGFIMDGTPFIKRLTVSEMEKVLELANVGIRGEVVMYNGQTGRKFNSPVFFGPCYYQRLKHMTEDKLHFRARGQVTMLCKQPNSGLQRDGGLRFGEMERDSCITHGGAQFLRERLLLVSDYYTLPICMQCGQTLIRIKDPRPGECQPFYKCTFCRVSRVGGMTIELPYAAKLLFQELGCMNIKVILTSKTVGSKLKGAVKVPEGKADRILDILKHQNSMKEWSNYFIDADDTEEAYAYVKPSSSGIPLHETLALRRSNVSYMLKNNPLLISDQV